MDKILEKIQKLINLQEGAESIGSLAEAENAATRIQEMLLKYNLTRQEVEKMGMEEKSKVIEDNMPLALWQKKNEGDWVGILAGILGRYYLVGVVEVNNRSGLTLLGEPHNVEVLLYALNQLVSKIRIAEKLSWSKYSHLEKRGSFRRGFLLGAVTGISRKLRELQQKMEEQSPQLGLMVLSKKDQLYTAMQERFPNLKQVRDRGTLQSQRGIVLGLESGSKMSINYGVGN